ncbi:MAG: GNAT family N-acetyltransferase [Acidobacteriota bacterium]|nr:GNAT family N-acetyltransferase [Acidobacteriota bacterium]
MNWSFWSSGRSVADIRTARLRLVAITPTMLAAEKLADGSVSKLLRARLTAEWPPEHWEPHVLDFILKQIEDDVKMTGWNRYVLLPDASGRGRTLIGCVGGFVKPEGDVEIGYSTLPEFQRRGYATEAAVALVEWLLKCEGVQSVSAQTFPRLPESIKVMERCGLRYVGDGDEEGTVRYRRTR